MNKKPKETPMSPGVEIRYVKEVACELTKICKLSEWIKDQSRREGYALTPQRLALLEEINWEK